MKLSIAIPTYNRHKYLQECLESIKNQNKGDYQLEVVIVDDYSNDETKEIIDIYKDFLDIKYSRNTSNFGETYTMTKACSLCSGDYICLLHDDDTLTQDALNVYSGAIHKYSPDYLYTPMYVVGGKSKIWRYKHYDDKSQIVREILYNGSNPIPEIMVIKSSLQHKILNEMWHQRHIYAFYLNDLQFLNLRYIDLPTKYYRLHDSNVCSSLNGLLERNKGVINMFNIILFKYAYSQKDIKSILFASIKQMKSFICGRFYTKQSFKKDDHIWLIFYLYSKALYSLYKKLSGAFDDDVERILNSFATNKNFIELNLLPKDYSGFSPFVFYPRNKYHNFIIMDILNYGVENFRNSPKIYDSNLSVKVHTPMNDEEFISCLKEYPISVININYDKQYLLEKFKNVAVTVNIFGGEKTIDHINCYDNLT